MKPTTDETRWRIGLAALAFLLCYARVIATVVGTWATSATYSFGFIVPLVGGYVLWTKWPNRRTPRPGPNYWLGVPVTLAGIAMLVAGQVGALTSLQEASLVVSLAGFGLLLFGGETGAWWFPLLYLLLGLPIWDPLIGRLQPPSQILSGRIAVALLHAVGVPAVQDGILVTLPKFTLEILRECSGVNQIIAIVAMGVPAAYLWLEGAALRTAFVGLAVAVAYLTNGFRIALTGVLALYGLANVDFPGLHLIEGLGVAVISYVPIIGCLFFLAGMKPTDQRAPDGAASAGSPEDPPLRVRHLWLECSVLAVVLFAAAFPLWFRPADVRLPNELRGFPSHVDDWTMETNDQPLAGQFPAIDDTLLHAYPSPARARRFTGVDDELVRTYQSPLGDRVRLYVGYYRHQEDGKELAGDASVVLHAAATPVRIELVESGAIEVNQVLWPESGSPRGTFFWYDSNGRIVNSIYAAKAYMLWDAFTRRRTNGAVIMVAWECPPSGRLEASRQQAMAFVRALTPLLARYLRS